MQEVLVNFATTQAPAIAILSIGWYFLVKYFMGQINEKDKQNQANLDRYITLTEKNMEVMGKFSIALDWLHPKLDAMHDDIKYLRNKN